jgi:hypothetical protein
MTGKEGNYLFIMYLGTQEEGARGGGSGANSHDEYSKIGPLYKCCSHDRYHTLGNTIETVKQGW